MKLAQKTRKHDGFTAKSQENLSPTAQDLKYAQDVLHRL